jgi:Ca-activated chloride channel family protein
MNGYFEFAWLPGLLGLLLIPGVVWLRYLFGRSPIWVVPYVAAWGGSEKPPKSIWRALAMYLAIVLTILAAAKPQWNEQRLIEQPAGADIVIAIDLSTSMHAEDYIGVAGPLDRLSALKPVLQEFVTSRASDRIALVVFAGSAYTLVPLTRDRAWVVRQIDQLRIGMIEDGTAIGDGLGLALAQFESTPTSAGRFVVLVTDGANTSGRLTPPQSTIVARHLSVPVYTVAAGRDGFAPYPLLDAQGRRIGTRQQPSTIDRESLRTIAEKTGGAYFDGEDLAGLSSAFEAIDISQQSVTDTKISTVRRDLRHYFVAAVLALLVLVLASLLRQRLAGHSSAPNIRRGFVKNGRLQIDASAAASRLWPFATMLTLVALITILWPQREPAEDSGAQRKQLLIALDLSRSMDARDLLPSRLEHARRLALRAVDTAADDLEIGLMVFAGDSFLVAPISTERSLLRRALENLQTGDMLVQGTDFDSLLTVAMQSFDPRVIDRSLLILSDGEAQPNNWQQRVSQLASERIRSLGVMFGSAATTPIPINDSDWLRNSRGMFIYSSASTQPLELLSVATNGSVWSAIQQADLLDRLGTAIAGEQASGSDVGSHAWLVSDWRSLALLLIAVALVLAFLRDLPAMPRLSSLLLIVVASSLTASLSVQQLVAEPSLARRAALAMQSAEERDALVEMQRLVAELITKPVLTAEDYQRVAATAIDYGAIHRLHSHPLALGVLRDGLVAVERGRQLEPEWAIWGEQAAMLQRLLEPPPPALADPGEVDPANEPLEGRLSMPDPPTFEPEDESGQRRERDDDTEGPRSLGGGALDVFDAKEWGDPAITVPLYLVRETRRTDRFGDVFRALQQVRPEREQARVDQAW